VVSTFSPALGLYGSAKIFSLRRLARY